MLFFRSLSISSVASSKRRISKVVFILPVLTFLINSVYTFLEAYSHEQTLIVQKIVSEHNGTDFIFAEDPEAKKELWKVVNLISSKLFAFCLNFV